MRCKNRFWQWLGNGNDSQKNIGSQENLSAQQTNLGVKILILCYYSDYEKQKMDDICSEATFLLNQTLEKNQFYILLKADTLGR